MQLIIEGGPRQLTDIRAFRAAYDLPDDFGVNLFEPKDYAGLGRIDRAGEPLNALRRAVLAAIPVRLSPPELFALPEALATDFRRELVSINAHVGLRDAEIDYAAAGFEDVCRGLCDALVRAAVSDADAPDFNAIYGAWLAESVRCSAREHEYSHRDEAWTVRVINNVYGRIGLKVERGESVEWVYDGALACPAEGFMYGLLAAVAEKIIAAA